MRPRTEFQALLEAICPHVYFQPPESISMKYPCIVYNYAQERVNHADNKRYIVHRRYDLTLIDKDPDSAYVDKIEEIPFSSFDRGYRSDNLNHYVFEVYY